MSTVKSVRLSEDVARRLRERSRLAGESQSALIQRLVDEGLRMDAHPGVVFRPGPTGRRAAVLGGPDVWEIVGLVRSLAARGERAVAEASEWLGLRIELVRAALAYYAEFSDEIEARIRADEETAGRARRMAEAQERLLG